jgi:hypothetical protein
MIRVSLSQHWRTAPFAFYDSLTIQNRIKIHWIGSFQPTGRHTMASIDDYLTQAFREGHLQTIHKGKTERVMYVATVQWTPQSRQF